MNTQLLEKLEKLALRENWNTDEEMNAYDYSGGNYDDAYSGGYNDGLADMARVVLAGLKKDNPS